MVRLHPHAAHLARRLQARLEPPGDPLSLDVPGTTELGAWFLGPKAGNEDLLLRLAGRALAAHAEARRAYAPSDPPYLTGDEKGAAYQAAVQTMEGDLDRLLEALRGSIPLASYRNQSHMYWDVTLPGVLGYLGAVLYNQNNVAAEASPVTTYLEMLVGDDLCRMLGYTIPSDAAVQAGALRPWGHITCDGSVANTESMWAARNLKSYPLSVAGALRAEPSLDPARGLVVPLPTGGEAPLIDLGPWRLLNLRVDDVLALPGRIATACGLTPEALNAVLHAYTLQHVGVSDFEARFLPDPRHRRGAVFVPATAHYSWPKAAALLGLGSGTVVDVAVDLDARMDLDALAAHLEACLAAERPVIQVVAVVGSTEESAVDPLAEIVALREAFRQRGLEFALHIDAAWGGYFASMLREDPYAEEACGAAGTADPAREVTPEVAMSAYVTRQYEAFGHADTITVDPHKSGCIPYPAGGLCYRNGAMRNLVSFTAPVVYHGGLDPTVGVYGVEGSKPGAAAAAVYLSHRVIRPNRRGYGKLLAKCMWNSNRLYAALSTMATDEDPFVVVPFQRLPAERAGASPEAVREQLAFLRDRIVPKGNDALLQDAEAVALLKELGADQIIVAYSVNFREEGVPNPDLTALGELTDAVYRSLSLHAFADEPFGEVPRVPMFVTSSSFDPATYGQAFVDTYTRRLGAVPAAGFAVPFLISTTMDPWVTDVAPTPAYPDGNFIPALTGALRTTILRILRQGRPFRPVAVTLAEDHPVEARTTTS